jgi:DNA mismatch endonuclease (patch repair protein)
MAAIRRSETKPEREFRSALHRRGYRFRKDLRLPTSGGYARPDVVFTRRRIAVFIDGCFWHSCPLHGAAPSVNSTYWGPKLARTRERDAQNTAWLVADGWTVVRIWTHVPLVEALNAFEHVFDNTAPASPGAHDSPGHMQQVG